VRGCYEDCWFGLASVQHVFGGEESCLLSRLMTDAMPLSGGRQPYGPGAFKDRAACHADRRRAGDGGLQGVRRKSAALDATSAIRTR